MPEDTRRLACLNLNQIAVASSRINWNFGRINFVPLISTLKFMAGKTQGVEQMTLCLLSLTIKTVNIPYSSIGYCSELKTLELIIL